MDYRTLAYVFGVGCNIIGLIMYNYAVSNERNVLIGSILITVGIVSLLFSYSK